MSSLSPIAGAGAWCSSSSLRSSGRSMRNNKMGMVAAAGISNSSSSSSKYCAFPVLSTSSSSSSISGAGAVKHDKKSIPSGDGMKHSSAPGAAVVRTEARGILETFSKLRAQGKVAFIPYVTAGDPDLSTTAEALKLLCSCGADVIELGLPFCDPLLDGPVIQASNKRALANKTDLKAVVSMLKQVVPQISCPVVIFTYYNLILNYDAEWLFSSLRDAGVQGLIVPDLPFEESAGLREEAAAKNIDVVLFTTPTTTSDKMKAIADASRGFIYLVSSTGVTGTRSTVNPEVEDLIRQIKKETAKPVAVGFGISTPEHVGQISSWGADGVIVGSAIVRALGEADSKEEGLRRMESLVRSLLAALPLPNRGGGGGTRHHHRLNPLQDDSSSYLQPTR